MAGNDDARQKRETPPTWVLTPNSMMTYGAKKEGRRQHSSSLNEPTGGVGLLLLLLSPRAKTEDKAKKKSPIASVLLCDVSVSPFGDPKEAHAAFAFEACLSLLRISWEFWRPIRSSVAVGIKFNCRASPIATQTGSLPIVAAAITFSPFVK